MRRCADLDGRVPDRSSRRARWKPASWYNRAPGRLCSATHERSYANGVLDDLGQVAHPIRRDDETLRLRPSVVTSKVDCRSAHRSCRRGDPSGPVQPVHARIVELRRWCRRHGESRRRPSSKRSGGSACTACARREARRGLPALVELVDRDDVGEIEHVDLLELGRGAVLGSSSRRARRRSAR